MYLQQPMSARPRASLMNEKGRTLAHEVPVDRVHLTRVFLEAAEGSGGTSHIPELHTTVAGARHQVPVVLLAPAAIVHSISRIKLIEHCNAIWGHIKDIKTAVSNNAIVLRCCTCQASWLKGAPLHLLKKKKDEHELLFFFAFPRSSFESS